jgi:hypothetical protein
MARSDRGRPVTVPALQTSRIEGSLAACNSTGYEPRTEEVTAFLPGSMNSMPGVRNFVGVQEAIQRPQVPSNNWNPCT